MFRVFLTHRAVQVHDSDFFVEITMELDSRLEEIIVVPEDVARVIANLVSNACQAMLYKAREGASDCDYQPELKVATACTEDRVMILVRDNGTGMTREVREKMFNPFFTTKESIRNTGLGLSLAYDVIREHGGNIKVDSEPGKHTEMTVILPKRP